MRNEREEADALVTLAAPKAVASKRGSFHNLNLPRTIMSTKKILIVEDDSDLRLGYHILLKGKLYDTFFAKDPLSCLSEAHKHRPDLIILDLGLPFGDGFRVMEQFKAVPHLEGIPIIVVSGADIHTAKDRALKCGAKAYLQKPADNAELLTLISQLIGESSEGPSQADSASRRLAEVDT